MDVAAWLRGLGLERDEQAFLDNEIDVSIAATPSPLDAATHHVRDVTFIVCSAAGLRSEGRQRLTDRSRITARA
jgi:hypothetical protein